MVLSALEHATGLVQDRLLSGNAGPEGICERANDQWDFVELPNGYMICNEALMQKREAVWEVHPAEEKRHPEAAMRR